MAPVSKKKKIDYNALVSACLQKYVEEPIEPESLETILEMVYSLVKPTDYQKLVPILSQCYACARMKKENVFLKTLPSVNEKQSSRDRDIKTSAMVREFFEDVFSSQELHAKSFSTLGDMTALDYCLFYMFLAATSKRRIEDKAFPIVIFSGESSTGMYFVSKHYS